jgi:hypothetical protein
LSLIRQKFVLSDAHLVTLRFKGICKFQFVRL